MIVCASENVSHVPNNVTLIRLLNENVTLDYKFS